MSCSKISADIAHQCLDKLATGIKNTIVLINIEDLDKLSCTFDANNKMICTNLALVSASPSVRGFKLEGFNFSNEHDTALVKRKFIDGWEHNMLFRIFDNTPEVKKWINEAAGSRFVVVYENNYSNDNAATPGTTVYEIAGFKYGLEISEATRNAQDEESMGGWVLKAVCDEVNKEPYMPYTYFVGGTLALTKAAFEGLYD